MRRGRIVDLQKRKFNSCAITQGISKEEQPYYDNNDRFKGSNGTYAHDFESDTSYVMKIVVYEDEQNPQLTVTTDITDLIKEENPSWIRVSPQRLEKLKQQIVGKKIDMVLEDAMIGFDSSILTIEE